MENIKTKKEIVKMLLNQNLQTEDENQLIEMLIDEPISVDVDKSFESLKFSDRLSDKITAIFGSWTFILLFVTFMIGWIILNVSMIDAYDAYPFVLLNLVLSCIAALQAPIIMMSQNRSAQKDSMRSKNDYKIDLKSELILEVIHHQMTDIQANQRRILKLIDTEESTTETKK